MRILLLLSGSIALLLLASSCSEVPASPGPPPVITDTTPVGEGLKTLAYAFLGASVVLTLGRLLR